MATPEPKPAKILIADDDVLVAMYIQQTVSLIGFEVVGIAATVSDALCLAQNTRPDLAIFDIQLAGKRDGIEGAALLRSLLDIPVVFLSGQGDEHTRARADTVHPAAFITKPASPQQVVAAIEHALRHLPDGAAPPDRSAQ
jgi:DNA-binding NarL/FixJ family response regulator